MENSLSKTNPEAAAGD